eukprot:2458252-Rhodomonas_salina.1
MLETAAAGGTRILFVPEHVLKQSAASLQIGDELKVRAMEHQQEDVGRAATSKPQLEVLCMAILDVTRPRPDTAPEHAETRSLATTQEATTSGSSAGSEESCSQGDALDEDKEDSQEADEAENEDNINAEHSELENKTTKTDENGGWDRPSLLDAMVQTVTELGGALGASSLQ